MQGMCKDFYQLRVKTMPAPLIKTGQWLHFHHFNECLRSANFRRLVFWTKKLLRAFFNNFSCSAKISITASCSYMISFYAVHITFISQVADFSGRLGFSTRNPENWKFFASTAVIQTGWVRNVCLQSCKNFLWAHLWLQRRNDMYVGTALLSTWIALWQTSECGASNIKNIFRKITQHWEENSQ